MNFDNQEKLLEFIKNYDIKNVYNQTDELNSIKIPYEIPDTSILDYAIEKRFPREILKKILSKTTVPPKSNTYHKVRCYGLSISDDIFEAQQIFNLRELRVIANDYKIEKNWSRNKICKERLDRVVKNCTGSKEEAERICEEYKSCNHGYLKYVQLENKYTKKLTYEELCDKLERDASVYKHEVPLVFPKNDSRAFTIFSKKYLTYERLYGILVGSTTIIPPEIYDNSNIFYFFSSSEDRILIPLEKVEYISLKVLEGIMEITRGYALLLAMKKCNASIEDIEKLVNRKGDINAKEKFDKFLYELDPFGSDCEQD